MPSYFLLSNTPLQTEDATTGAPASGFTLSAFLAGTTTPTNMYSDNAGTVIGTSVTTNSAGYPQVSGDIVSIWLDSSLSYKLVLEDASSVTVWESDNVTSSIISSDYVASYDDFRDNIGFTVSDFPDGSVIYFTDDGIAGMGVMKTDAGATDDGGVIIKSNVDTTRYWERVFYGPAFIEWFESVGDNSTDNLTAITNALSWQQGADGRSLASRGGTHLISSNITQSVSYPVIISSVEQFTIKASGSNRLYHLRFTGCSSDVVMNGVTIDGANIAARPLDIDNQNATATRGDVSLLERFKCINARNNSPDTFTATGVNVRGGFNKVFFDGEIDGVDSTLTSGAVSEGLAVIQYTTDVDDYTRTTVMGGNARIRNVKNSNTTTADADGLKVRSQTTSLDSMLVVSPGATFDECEGRAIKSQVTNSIIVGAVVNRSLYDGLTEINAQYSGGVISNCKIFHNGARANTIIGCTFRTSPDQSEMTIRDNEFTEISAGGSNSGTMVAIDGTDDTVPINGVIISGNKAHGTIERMWSARVGTAADNFLQVENNWAKTVNTSFGLVWRILSGNPKCLFTHIGNSCENTAPLAIEEQTTTAIPTVWESNYNIPDYALHFRAYLSSTAANVTGDGTAYDVIFDTENYDPHGQYAAGSGTFTAPIAGDYRFETNVLFAGITVSENDMENQIRSTSTSHYFADINPSTIFTSGGRIATGGATEMTLAEGDTVTVRVDVGGGSKVVDIESRGESTFFSGKLVRV